MTDAPAGWLKPSTRELFADLQRLLLSQGGQYLVAPSPEGPPTAAVMTAGGRNPRLGVVLIPWDAARGLGFDEVVSRVLAQLKGHVSLCILVTSTDIALDSVAVMAAGDAAGVPLVVADAARREARGVPGGVALVEPVFEEGARERLEGIDASRRITQTDTARREHSSFLQVLHEATPKAYVTTALLAANIAVFGAMAVFANAALSPTVEALRSWGAQDNLLTGGGQWWRLLTSMFIHIGFLHLLFNMWCLRNLGPLNERLFGNGAFALLYIASGLGGSVATLVWHPWWSVSAGASGAIFGLCGGLIAFMLVRRGTIPRELYRSIMSSSLMFVVVNVVFGLTIAHINNTAHIGGLVTGLVVGAILSRSLPVTRSRWNWARYIVAAAVAAAIIGGGVLVGSRRFSDPVEIATNGERDDFLAPGEPPRDRR